VKTTVSAVAKSNPIRSDDANGEVKSAFHAWRKESMPLNETLPYIADEDFILADILERSAINEEDTSSHSNSIYLIVYKKKLLSFYYFVDNQSNLSSLFRPITPTNTDELVTYQTRTGPPVVIVISEQQKTNNNKK
jgi:hypothetical protein